MLSLSIHSLPLLSASPLITSPVLPLTPLPERVLQFGTGVLLRGLPDYLIDKANRQGIFNGRIVLVKSTEGGDIGAFHRQDNLYTLCIRGVENHRLVEENVICSAISRVLSARQQWDEVLRVATSPDLHIVLSNTTESGIELVAEDIRLNPPLSFPGKLLAVLYARYQAFAGDPAQGLVVVPTELLPDNGTRLEAILLELAHGNGLHPDFIDWLETANVYCNSLVDRIVPGKPEPARYHSLSEDLGYRDELLITAEVYGLWAIEVPKSDDVDRIKQVLSFHQADDHVIIQPDINRFRELKLRLLNGSHTLSCGLAFLSGFDTVSDAMADGRMAEFVHGLIMMELIPGLSSPVDPEMAERFGSHLLDRYRNPFIEHYWLDIARQYSKKMLLRNIPTLVRYYQTHQDANPPLATRYLPLGFAAYLLFMRATTRRDGLWYGERNGETYLIADPQAAYFSRLWEQLPPAELARVVLQNINLWEQDLTRLPGFADAVAAHLTQLVQKGPQATLDSQFAPYETATP